MFHTKAPAAPVPQFGADGMRSMDLRTDPFMSSMAPPGMVAAPVGAAPQQQQQKKAVPEDKLQILEITFRRAENLPPPEKGGKKQVFPVAVCEVEGKPESRIQTPMCTNHNKTNPVWGTEPAYFKAHVEEWEEGDTLTFTIQDEDATSTFVIGRKDLQYKDYKNGYEWWLPLEVARMKRYPEGWPYAAIQLKIQLVQGIKLTAEDPWMTRENLAPAKHRGCCAGCGDACFNCRMWCCRRLTTCCLCTWVQSKWCCMMGCMLCGVSFLECNLMCGMVWDWMTGKESLRELRRDCAKRLRLPDAEDDEDDQDTACCCVPLRMAVFLISVLSTFNAVLSVFFPGSGGVGTGGYDVTSRVIVGATQITGLFFGPIGCMGAYDLNVNLLSAYNTYQLVRLAGMFLMFYRDIPLLSDCDLWKTDINAAIAKYGWNPAMYNVAMGNNCLQTTTSFALISVFSVIIYVYLISLTRKLIWDTEMTPKYLLAMPRDVPSGSFVRHNRTQGRSKPPYEALLGKKATQQRGLLSANQQGGLVGQPVYGAAPGMNPQNFSY